MAYHTLRTDLERGVLTVRLHRPERLNAFSPTMLRELLALLDDIDTNDEIRVAIVTGEGRAFCAGADLGGGGGTFDRSAEEASSAHRDGGGLVAQRL
jgi:enoyl-CoA hydratase/carnithine racemase